MSGITGGIRTRQGLSVVFIVVAAVVLLINTASVRDGADNAEASAVAAVDAAAQSRLAVARIQEVTEDNAVLLQAINDKSLEQTLTILRTTVVANFCAVLVRPQSDTQFVDFLDCLDRLASRAEDFNPAPLGQ